MITQPNLAGGRVRLPGRAASRSMMGRACVEPGCSNRLSIYDRHETCFRHRAIRSSRIQKVEPSTALELMLGPPQRKW